MYGWNPGNLTCGAVPGGSACGSNPLVTSGLSFALFPGLLQGAEAYVAFLQKHGAYSDLLSGDVGTFAQALQRIGYAGADMQADGYAGGMNAWLPKLRAVAVIPPASSGGGITIDQGIALGVAGIVGLFVGSWAAEGFKRPKVRPRWT